MPDSREEGQPVRYDHEYERKGVCSQILFVEPLRGWRKVFVRQRRTMIDWAFCLRKPDGCWNEWSFTTPPNTGVG